MIKLGQVCSLRWWINRWNTLPRQVHKGVTPGTPVVASGTPVYSIGKNVKYSAFNMTTATSVCHWCTSPREPQALASIQKYFGSSGRDWKSWKKLAIPCKLASIQKSFGSSGRDWKSWKKLPIPCKFRTHRFIRYSSTCYGKVHINPLMANIRNPDFFASLVVNAAWFVVVRPCYLNRDLLSGPKGISLIVFRLLMYLYGRTIFVLFPYQ